MTLRDESAPAWHALPGEEALRRLESRPEGLSDAEVTARLEAQGRNVLPEPAVSSQLVVLLRQFKSPLIYILLAASVVSLALGAWSDALFILAVLVLDAGIGAVLEWRAETSAAALKQVLHVRPTVLRGGARREIDAADLAPGDVILLESGGAVPADLRLLSVHDLRIDESLLTGESAVVEKAEPALDTGTPLADRRNMAFAGSMVLAGRGTGVVCATAGHTQLGAIARALGPDQTPPPLLLRMRTLSRRIAVATVVVVAMLAVGQYLRGAPLAEIFSMTIAIAVSAIPEGLSVAITIALAVASARMARRHVIVRRLPAVEGLGSCTLIATDKTGTLTVNRLTVKRIALPSGVVFDIDGEGLDPHGDVVPEPSGDDRDAVRRLATAAALANEARLHSDNGAVEASGDSVDVAFLVLAAKLGLNRDGLLEVEPQQTVIPYESLLGFSASEGSGLVRVKGSPERILTMCEGVDPVAANAQVHRLAEAGYRVIAIAEGTAGVANGRMAPADLRGLRLLGFAGLIDPIRPEVPEAIAACRAAGVEVRMITGDHPETALAIARQIYAGPPPERAVTGSELARLSGPELERCILGADVFARVEPGQKTMIVQALQANGHFVAVTGDGVNDAPALRAAQVGVSMGASGTDVARAAAELIVTDDNFASIVAGIEEGRTAYANIRKIVWLLMSTAVAEVLLFSLTLLTGLPMPLTAVQILWLNLVHEGIQDVALAMERKEPDTMRRPPRPPRQAIFDRQMIEQCILTGVYIGAVSYLLFAWLTGPGGYDLPEARNLTLLFLVLFDNVHVLNCRSETRSVVRIPLSANPVLITTLVGAPALHVLAMNTPGLRDVLDLQPVNATEWLFLGLLAASVLLVGEGYKLVRARPLLRRAVLTRLSPAG
ncbi:MAG: HAD-IC family P-type ATPase [Caulobacter sp.]|nr:HAD-IC family P-type ATPase [Caulobacter sp.]